MFNRNGRGTTIALMLAAALGAACNGSPHAESGPGAEVRAFTGARTRLVWVQGDGSDPYAAGTNLVLMGFDSDDGRGERVIREQRGSYMKPMLAPRGERLVYSTNPELKAAEVFLVNFDGSGWKRLTDGFALAVWADPADQSEWIYVGRGGKSFNFPTVVRFPIDDPSREELVWNKTLVSGDTFQVTADGKRAGGLFPWPTAGVADLPNGSLRQVGEGCWTAINMVRGPLFWYFDGAHRNLLMYDVSTEKRWKAPINTAPGFNDPEVYHPRWTNHPRFLAMSGPYNRGGANQVRSGGTQSEIWLGRFSEDFVKVEAWARVTNNGGGDSYPDVWIDRARSPYPARARGHVGPAAASGGAASGQPGSAAAAPARVVVEARLARTGSIPSPQSILPYRHALIVGEYDVVKVLEGTYGEPKIRAAHWAIRDGRVLPDAARNVGATLRLTLERYDAHPELEGERLLSDIGASQLPLYYQVGR